MKQMRVKIIVMFMLVFIVSSIYMGIKRAEAENLPTVYGTEIKTTAGKEVKVPVLIKDNQGMAGFRMRVTYDESIMRPVKVEKGKMLSEMNGGTFDSDLGNNTGNSFDVLADNAENFCNGELLILTFEVLDSVKAASYKLQLQVTEGYRVEAGAGANFSDVMVNSEAITITITGEDNPVPTPDSTPVSTPDVKNGKYVWEGEVTGWGGSDSYPSSAGHLQGSGEDNFYYIDLTNINFYLRGYGCGIEFMNPYNHFFIGAENEMAQFFKKMKNPRIKVTLKNGGAASSWNWETELSFPSGVEMTLPAGYLDTGYFALFGNDDVITKVEFYDSGANEGQGSGAVQQPNGSGDNANKGYIDDQGGKQTQAKDTNASGSSKSKKKKVKKPGKVTGLELTWERKKLWANWNGKSNNSGYQVQCAQNRKFTKKKKNKKSSVSLCNFRGLQRGKTYYVRVRAYKKASGKKVYGKWSTVKKIKI